MGYAATQGHTAAVSDRRRIDRRERHPLLSDCRWLFTGRRRNHRRVNDLSGSRCVLDWYSPRFFFFAVTTYILSATDAALTLYLINHGLVIEANPIMNALMVIDVNLFVQTKALVTGVGLVGLVAYCNLRLLGRIPVAYVIYGLFVIYSILVSYEIALIGLL